MSGTEWPGEKAQKVELEGPGKKKPVCHGSISIAGTTDMSQKSCHPRSFQGALLTFPKFLLSVHTKVKTEKDKLKRRRLSLLSKP